MVKIRIWGSEKEVEQVTKSLQENDNALTVTKQSKKYQDRKPSELYRIYLEVELPNRAE